MIIRSVEFNLYTLEVKGFDLESKTIRVKVENSVYITYETDNKELLYIMSCSLEFDEICKLLERRIKNIEHSKILDDYIERKDFNESK